MKLVIEIFVDLFIILCGTVIAYFVLQYIIPSIILIYAGFYYLGQVVENMRINKKVKIVEESLIELGNNIQSEEQVKNEVVKRVIDELRKGRR